MISAPPTPDAMDVMPPLAARQVGTSARPVGAVTVCATDSGMTMLSASPAFCDLVGMTRAGLVGQSFAMLHGPATDIAAWEMLHYLKKRELSGAIVMALYGAEGAPVWCRSAWQSAGKCKNSSALFLGVHCLAD